MTTQTPHSPFSALRWQHAVTFCCLLLIGGVLIFEHDRLSELAVQVQNNTAPNLPVESLEERLSHLEQLVDSSARKPAPITQVELDALRQPLEERLEQIEQSHTAQIEQDSALQVLQERLTRLEARQEQRQPIVSPAPAPPHQPTVKVTKPRVITPPFSVLGVELRGGERFLSVSPGSSASLSHVRLLRPGEAENGWRLESLEEKSAVFRVNGHIQRLSIP
jgi:hypothetical protein